MGGSPGGGEATACAVCGCTVEGAPPLTWSSATGPRGTSWVCERCTRHHVRSMEAQLEPEHW